MLKEKLNILVTDAMITCVFTKKMVLKFALLHFFGNKTLNLIDYQKNIFAGYFCYE
jgi:hypothetical protein